MSGRSASVCVRLILQLFVLCLRHRYDRWPEEGGRPAATTDGLFEISHARLVRLLATLCPTQLCEALEQPLTQRLQQHPAPSGPAEKAEVAAVAETLAGLLAAAAPVAAAGSASSSSNSWAIRLLKNALSSSTLEMSDAWGAAVWYAVDHLLDSVTATGSNSKDSSSNGGAAAMEVEELGGAASSPAAVMLQQVLNIVLAAVPGASTAAQQQQQPGAATTAAAGALTSDVKRLKYLLSCLPPVRRLGTLGVSGQNQLAASAQDTETDQPTSAAAVVAAAAIASSSHPTGYVSSSEGATARTRLPKSVRVFLAAVMHELQGLLEVEQPTAMRECIGSLLADVAGIFAAPAPIMLPPSAAAAADAGQGSNGGSSGCSSPVEIEVPAHGAVAQGIGTSEEGTDLAPEVLLLNSSVQGLRRQAAQLLQQTIGRFATHAALLETLKSSGSSTPPSGSSSNLAAAGGSGSGANTPPYRNSDNSDDIVMVEAPGTPAAATAEPAGLGAGLNRSPPASLSLVNPASLARSLTHCGVGLQMIIAMIDSGESASLRPLLAALLPGVLALQELSGPGVQQLSSEAKAGFVLYKYLPFGPRHAAGVSAVILCGGGSEAWSTRAAALVFLQVFWFGHCYLLAEQDMEQLQVRGSIMCSRAVQQQAATGKSPHQRVGLCGGDRAATKLA